jgi:hypothetical protein
VPEAKDPKLALFELYLATAEKVSDRRAQANSWMLSVNSAIVALYGYLQADKMDVGVGQKQYGFGRSRPPARSSAWPGALCSPPTGRSIAPSSKF